MSGIGAELLRAREAAGLSLAEVADATLINIRFLREIEAGRYDFLPQTYVRAFLREYATVVGLDPDDLLSRYDEDRSAAAGSPPASPHGDTTPAGEDTPMSPAPTPRAPDVQISPRVARMALLAVGVLAAGVIIWNALTPDQEGDVSEIPFEEVRAEHERADTAESADRAGSARAAAGKDSLTLVALASDSVWLQLRIDEGPVRTLILRRGTRSVWRAADRFTLTLGNAGGVEFTLNGTVLGRLGKQGAVVRARELSRTTLGPAAGSGR